jgi:transglutaminase-like putative cysteine protease
MSPPLRYAIRQTSRYTYAGVVPFARHIVRLTPVTSGPVEVESQRLIVDPAPEERSERIDFFGNGVLDIALEDPHATLDIVADAAVTVHPEAPLDPAATPAWEDVRETAYMAHDLGPRSPVHFLFNSRLVPIDATIGFWAAQSFRPARPVLAGGLDLMRRIKSEFAYDPTATDVATPTRQAFELKRGVCQDFAHVMIAGLRWLGLPAGYVSGYLRTTPPPGRPRLEGADAMHAWVALWCGPEAGWQGLDPTNAIIAGVDHIPIAFGRDYADVSPIDGVIVAAGGHTLEVAVDVVERA